MEMILQVEASGKEPKMRSYGHHIGKPYWAVLMNGAWYSLFCDFRPTKGQQFRVKVTDEPWKSGGRQGINRWCDIIAPAPETNAPSPQPSPTPQPQPESGPQVIPGPNLAPSAPVVTPVQPSPAPSAPSAPLKLHWLDVVAIIQNGIDVCKNANLKDEPTIGGIVQSLIVSARDGKIAPPEPLMGSIPGAESWTQVVGVNKVDTPPF